MEGGGSVPGLEGEHEGNQADLANDVVDDGVVEERVGTAGITHRQQLQRGLPVSENGDDASQFRNKPPTKITNCNS